MLEVGRVGRAHGLRGDVIVSLVTDRLERVAPGAVLHADGRTLVVQRSSPHQGGHIVHFEGVDDRNDADALRNVVLHADPIDDPEELWAHELIGHRVIDRAGVGRGTVVAVQDNPAHDLLVLDTGHLVPVVFVVEIAHDIVIDPPEGLFDL